MVETFKTINMKTGNQETIYVVTGKAKNRTEILKEVASYKKESLERVKAKFKKVAGGYMVESKGMIWLYDTDGSPLPKGAKPCVIVRR